MKYKVILKGFIIISFFGACTSENEKETLLSQEVAIDNYINAQLTAADSVKALEVVANNSSYRLIYKYGTGDVVASGDSVEFLYVASIFSNGRGPDFDTNLPDSSRTDAGSLYPHSDLGKGIAGQGFYIPGLDNGLMGMKAGEQAQIVFSAAQGYGNKSVGIVPPLSPLLFNIYLEKVKKN